MKCEYNNGCEDYAEDGSWKSWNWNVPDNAEATHEIEFVDKDSDCVRQYSVCDGCLSDIEFDCENKPDEYEFFYSKRIAPRTKSYEGKRSHGPSTVHQVWSEEIRERILKKLKVAK